MDWSGRCRRLRAGRVLNDNKCVTVPFPLLHATHLNLPSRRFYTLVSSMPLLSVLVYCYRPTSCVFPSFMACEGKYLVSFTSPFPFIPFLGALSPCLNFTTLTRILSLLTNFTTKKVTINQIPHYSFVSASIYLTQTHILSRNIILTLFLFILLLHSTSMPFFFPSNHNVLPTSFFFSLSGAIFLCFFLTLLHIDPSHCEHRHTFPFLPYDQPTLCRILLSM